MVTFFQGYGQRNASTFSQREFKASVAFWRPKAQTSILGDEFRRFSITPGDAADGIDGTGLGFGRVTVELHILVESSTKGDIEMPLTYDYQMNQSVQ